MLPLTFQFLIAMVAHAINERMARRLDYLQEEVREQMKGIREWGGKFVVPIPRVTVLE